MRFRDRAEAGRLLAERLGAHADDPNVIVLGLPRGGVPVASEVARFLRAPLDVFLVRKLGVPGQPELALGAIASGGIRVLNGEVVAGFGIAADEIERVAEEEQLELERRERLYRGGRPQAPLAGRTVILVDDGIATGSTMRAALRAVRAQGPLKLVAASPVIAASALPSLEAEADEVAAVITPEQFCAVGEWYARFGQTGDDEVRSLLGAR